jgi:hypothetical protein
MRWLACRFVVAAIVSFGGTAAVVMAQSPAPVATPPDRSIHVTLDGVQIFRKDLDVLVRGLYRAASTRVHTIEKKPSEMPTQSPYAYFAGRNATTGRQIVWLTTSPPPDNDGQRANDEYTAAYAIAALDAGYVGEPWKSLYADSVKNDATRVAFGEEISKAFDDASDQQKVAADADVAWFKKNIIVGMSRKDVYDALRSYGLVAYNYDYAPGRSIGTAKGLFGCERSDDNDRAAAAWPYAGEPLPKLSGGCAALDKSLGGHSAPEPFPSANLTLDSAFSIACGSDINVDMTFGPGDVLKKLDISKPDWGCV